MAKWYEVTSSFYDDGHTVAAITAVVEAETCPKSINRSIRRCDVYIDYFKTHKEAEQWVKDTKTA